MKLKMEYGFLILILIIGILGYMELSKLKAQVKQQQQQLDKLCQATQNEELSASFVSDEMKHSLIELKKAGKDVEAVKKLREATLMGLVEAKKYIDML